MRRSVINSEYVITAELWVISILNTTRSLIEGHSAIVVEGVETLSDGLFVSSFIGQYEITAASEPAQEGSLNTTGYITKIKIFENEENKRDYKKENYPAKSYYASPSAAKNMILQIKADAKRTEEAMRNWSRDRDAGAPQPEGKEAVQPLKYQKLGKNHPLVLLFGDSGAGDNCAGWCLEKLAIAGIGDGTGKPKPAFQAGQCSII